MKYLRFYVIFLFIGFTVLSCNSEKKKMIKDLIGAYAIDTASCDYKLASHFIPKNLKLVLSKDGTYYFVPQISILKGYEGNWDLSDDWDISSYIFDCKNGEYQKTTTMDFYIRKNDHEYTICFGDKVK